MKLTYGEINNAKGPLGELMKVKLPVKTSIELAKLATKLDAPIKEIEQVREGLVKMYGRPDPQRPSVVKVDAEIPLVKDGKPVLADGKPVMVANPDYPRFLTEYGELMRHEVEIVVNKIALPETLEIEPTVVMALEKFVTVAS